MQDYLGWLLCRLLHRHKWIFLPAIGAIVCLRCAETRAGFWAWWFEIGYWQADSERRWGR